MDSVTAQALVEALGGVENIEDIRAYPSRVRVRVKDRDDVVEDGLRRSPVLAVFRSKACVHLIVGAVAQEMCDALSACSGQYRL